MNARVRQLQVVLDLAKREAHEAAQKFALHRNKLSQDEQQLLQLQNYYQHYLLTMNQQHQVSVTELLSYRQFSRQLSHSIDQCQLKLNELKGICENLRQQWLLKNKKCEALSDMVSRCLEEEREIMDKREQQEADELSQSRQARKNPWP